MTQEAAVPDGFMEQVRKIAAEEAAKVYRSASLRSASISQGDLTIKGGRLRVKYPDSTTDALYLGDLYTTGGYMGRGLLLQDDDGAGMLLASHDDNFGSHRVELYDGSGNPVVANDAGSKQGLARPYLGTPFYRQRYADMTVSTTSTTFETLWTATLPKQQPKLEVGVRATNDTSGSTGEVRILVNGVQMGSTIAQSFAIVQNTFGPNTVAGSHMQTLVVEIQGRMASGTGALRVEPIYMIGRQT